MPTKQNPKTELSQLLRYASRGFALFPAKLNKENHKVPLTKHGYKDATTDSQQITAWFNRFPDCLWALATGSVSGVTVVDLDVKDNANGVETVRKLLGKLPKTPTVTTWSGGLHLYFRYTEGLTIGSNKRDGVDFRNDGGYVILPPSRIQGQFYKWTTPFAFDKLATLPQTLLTFLLNGKSKVEKPKIEQQVIVTDDSKANALFFMQNILPVRAVEYDQWLNVLMCLHSVSEGDSQIVNTAMRFSQYYEGYSEREFFRKWNSAFRDDGGPMLTVGTLKHYMDEDLPVLNQMEGEAQNYLPLLSNKRFTEVDALHEIAQLLVPLGQRGRKIFADEVTSRVGGFSRKQCFDIFDSKQLKKDGEYTMAPLKELAESDSPDKADAAALKIPRKVVALTKHYENVLEHLGAHVALNTMNDRVYMNGVYMGEIEFAQLYSKLREFNLVDRELARTELLTISAKHKFHPFRDHLESMQWDGEPHIFNFCERYVRNEDKLFHMLFRKTLIGAVRRVFFNEHTPMLVLESRKQGIGKSRLVEWLASPFQNGFCTIDPRNLQSTDEKFKLCTFMIAELPEIDDLPRDDINRVKNLLTMRRVQARKAWSRIDTDKPVVTTIIGTFNNSRGFLSDPTGSRRFWPCSVENFDWDAYMQLEDPAQLWAEAVAAVLINNETSDLPQDVNMQMEELKDRYREETLTDEFLLTYFELTDNAEDTMTTLEVIDAIVNMRPNMKVDGILKREVTRTLMAAGLDKQRTTLVFGGKRVGGHKWMGIRPKEGTIQPFDKQVSREVQQFEELTKKHK